MKIVHSYIPTYDSNHLWKEAIYVQLLSALLAKREFGSIDFFTNKDIKNQILQIGIPYDNINDEILNISNKELFSVFKIKVFKEMNEPFVHIDTDTFIYNHIDFSKVNSAMFSHPDIPVPEHMDLHKTASEICAAYPNVEETDYFFKSARISYLDLFDKLSLEHSDFKKKNVRVCEIPNMNIIAVKNHSDFKIASEMALEHYYKNRDTIYNTKNGECYIEQLMIHLNLMEISNDYLNDVRNNSTFLMKGAPVKVVGKYDWPNGKIEYPLTILQNSIYDDTTPKEIKIDNLYYMKTDQDIYVSGHTGKLIQIKSMEDLTNYFDFDFNGINHLSFYKWNEVFQALIIGQIVKMFGKEYVESVFQYYYKNYGSDTSPGEKLYERLTGFEFKKQKTIL